MEKQEDIHEELITIAPLLANFPKSIPFRVPENYFEELETVTLVAAGLKEISEKEIVRDTSHPFAIPQNYFEILPEHILGKIKQPLAGHVSGRIIRMPERRWWLAAAAVALIVGTTFFFGNKNVVTTVSNNQIDTAYLLLENAATLPDAMVVDLYTESETASDDTLLNKYLIEVSSIDPETINSL